MKPVEMDAQEGKSPRRQARPAWPLRVLLTAWLFVLLATLGFMSLVWNLVALVLQLFLRGRKARRVGCAGISRGYRLYWAIARASGLMRLEAEELDALGAEPGGLIVAANHPSLLDALMIVARLPRGTCIMKSGLARNPFLGSGARLAGYVPNEPTRTMVRTAVGRLREGGQLVAFPEATRSPAPDRVHPFTRSVALIAQRSRKPIQTVLIETDSPYLGKGWPLWKLPPLPIVFRARLGRRFEPDADPKALSTRMEEYFRAELGR